LAKIAKNSYCNNGRWKGCMGCVTFCLHNFLYSDLIFEIVQILVKVIYVEEPLFQNSKHLSNATRVVPNADLHLVHNFVGRHQESSELVGKLLLHLRQLPHDPSVVILEPAAWGQTLRFIFKNSPKKIKRSFEIT
jgi:hypothetical protein